MSAARSAAEENAKNTQDFQYSSAADPLLNRSAGSRRHDHVLGRRQRNNDPGDRKWDAKWNQNYKNEYNMDTVTCYTEIDLKLIQNEYNVKCCTKIKCNIN